MTDAFTTAAEHEADRVTEDGDNAANGGFMAGALWARDHLAAQEPTDAEVEAATRVIYVRSHHSTGRQAPWERLDLEEQVAWLEDGRAALIAAKEAHIRARHEPRDLGAAQEPTDAECIHVLSVLGTDLGQPTRTDFEWSQAAIRRCREALTAAKEARS